MKTSIMFLAAIMFFSLTNLVTAQSDSRSKKSAEVKIATNLHCESCKAKIEGDLAFVKGVKTVNADVDSKVVTVTFNAKKTNAQALVERIQKLGYQASIASSCSSGSSSGCGGCKGSGHSEGSSGCKGKHGSGEGGCGGKN